MPGSPVQIGPFLQGLNTLSDPSSINDAAMVKCENFEIDLDGSLKSRPPFVQLSATMPLASTGNMQLLGYFYGPENVPYLIGTDGNSSTYYFDGSQWNLITNTFAATDMAQFNGKAYLLASTAEGNPSGSWDFTDGFVPDSNMPHGDAIVSFEQRLWVIPGQNATSNGTRIYFSNALSITPFWPVAPNFIDVGSGDGQNIVKLVVYFGSILVFRSSSVWIYNFNGDPAGGALNLLVPGVGLTDKNCVVPYQQFLYFLYNGIVYEFINNRATQINIQVPLVGGSESDIYLPYACSIFHQRLIVTYYDTMYVFNLQTRTWTTWKSETLGPIGKLIASPPSADIPSAIAHSSLAVQPNTTKRVAPTIQIQDIFGTVTEQMTCTLITKNYDYQAPSLRKRFFWGGVNGIFQGTLTATATPINYMKSLTWGQLFSQGFTWNQLYTGGYLWGSMTTDHVDLTDVVDGNTIVEAQRKFAKLWKSFFFRQLGFTIAIQTDGSQAKAPARIFSLMTYVAAKEQVVDEIS